MLGGRRDLREREVAAPERLELRHEEAAAGARERLALRGVERVEGRRGADPGVGLR